MMDDFEKLKQEVALQVAKAEREAQLAEVVE
jgi:hypothetical protein